MRVFVCVIMCSCVWGMCVCAAFMGSCGSVRERDIIILVWATSWTPAVGSLIVCVRACVRACVCPRTFRHGRRIINLADSDPGKARRTPCDFRWYDDRRL